MSQSLSAVYLHLVFSTKERQTFLKDKTLRSELHHYLGGIAREQDCRPVQIGGMEDHVHLLCRLGRTRNQADLVKELKRASTLWIKDRGPTICRDFAWQSGYAAFSVSVSNLEAVKDYIIRQEEHHQRLGFKEELVVLLKKHGLERDERYLWD